jgi:hypothetical protein
MKTRVSVSFLVIPAIAAAIPFTTLSAIGQDAGAQAAQQAAMQAQQQASQAVQQATDDAQRAAQQAMQDNMNAAQSSSSSAPPFQRPAIPRVPSGPVPAQIASARSVFIANVGAASNSPMDSTAAYEQFAADIAAWGHYRLAPSPAQADLVFELREVAPLTSVEGFQGDVESYSSPAFVLSIRDAKTNVVLWTLVSPIEAGGKKAERERWYALSVRNVVSRVKVLTRTPLTTQEMADLTSYPHTHAARNALLVSGAFMGAGAVVGLVLRSHFDNAAKQQQDQFCEQHGIPLSECVGG